MHDSWRHMDDPPYPLSNLDDNMPYCHGRSALLQWTICLILNDSVNYCPILMQVSLLKFIEIEVFQKEIPLQFWRTPGLFF